MHHVERGEHSRHRHRQRPDARDAGGIALRRGRGRGGAAAVEHDGPAGCLPIDLVEPVAAEPRHHRLDNAECHRGRDRRIDGVAAGAQRQEPGLRRQRMVRRDGAAPADRERPVGTHLDRQMGLLEALVPVYYRRMTGRPRHDRQSFAAGRRVTTRSALRRLALLLALLLAACTAGGSADDPDNGKNHGFYSGVTGGWSHP